MPSQFQTIGGPDSRNMRGACLFSPLSKISGGAHLQTLLHAQQIEDEDDDEYENDNFSTIRLIPPRLPEQPG